MVPVSLRLSHSRPHAVFVFFSFSLLTLLSTWAELIMGSCLWPTHLACLPPAAAHWPSFLPLLKVVALSFSLLDCWATWIPWTCPRTALKYLSVWVAWSVDPLPCTYIFSTVVLQINFWTLSEPALQSVQSALTIWWYDDGTSDYWIYWILIYPNV